MEPRKTGHGSSFFLLIRTLTAPLLVTLRGINDDPWKESYVNRSHLVSYSLLRIPRVFATPLTVSSGSERGAKPRGEETRGVE